MQNTKQVGKMLLKSNCCIKLKSEYSRNYCCHSWTFIPRFNFIFATYCMDFRNHKFSNLCLHCLYYWDLPSGRIAIYLCRARCFWLHQLGKKRRNKAQNLEAQISFLSRNSNICFGYSIGIYIQQNESKIAVFRCFHLCFCNISDLSHHQIHSWKLVVLDCIKLTFDVFVVRTRFAVNCFSLCCQYLDGGFWIYYVVEKMEKWTN